MPPAGATPPAFGHLIPPSSIIVIPPPAPPPPRRPLAERALAIAVALAELGCDAETVSAGLLAEAVEADALALGEVERQLGAAVAALGTTPRPPPQ